MQAHKVPEPQIIVSILRRCHYLLAFFSHPLDALGLLMVSAGCQILS